MIRLRHYHDGTLYHEDTIPFPSVPLQLLTAVKITLQRSRNGGFKEPIRDVDIRVIPNLRKVRPETVVPDGSTISVRTSSEERIPLEQWELD